MKFRIFFIYINIFISFNLYADNNVHQWSEQEISILQTLSIDSLAERPDEQSNAFTQNHDAIALGHQLFFDSRFSINQKVSCASCHVPDKYFTDGLKRSKGVAEVLRNAPTIVGASYNTWFFHDGRADSLWSQALGPLEDRSEHGASRSYYVYQLHSDAELKNAYEKIFGDLPNVTDQKRFPKHAGPVKDRKMKKAWQAMAKDDRAAITLAFVNIGKSIAAYESQLKPAASKFDHYVRAVKQNDDKQKNKLFSQQEAQGLRLFISKANCIICHSGPLFSDSEFHNTVTPPRSLKNYDWGRYKGASSVLRSKFNCFSQYNDAKDKNCDELTYIRRDKEHTIGAFKTPMLRNISKTAPYMHAGQYASLKEVIKHYNNPPTTKIGQSSLLAIPITLNEAESAQLEAFLHTLDSAVDADKRWLVPPRH